MEKSGFLTVHFYTLCSNTFIFSFEQAIARFEGKGKGNAPAVPRKQKKDKLPKHPWPESVTACVSACLLQATRAACSKESIAIKLKDVGDILAGVLLFLVSLVSVLLNLNQYSL